MLVAGVNGWIKEREDYITMWAGLEGIIKDSEVFTLVWYIPFNVSIAFLLVLCGLLFMVNV